MKHYLKTCCLLYGFYSVQTSPVREKISINTDLLNKVREGSNDTIIGGPGRNDRVHNFAWRITVTRTTTERTEPAVTLKPEPKTLKPVSTTLLSVDELSRNPEDNKIIHDQLFNTLKDVSYRNLWQTLVRQGYSNLIAEMRTPGACKIFMKDNYDGVLQGPAGEKLYEKMVNFLEAIGETGYKIILDSTQDEIPTLPELTTTPTTTTEATTVRRTTISTQDIEKNPEHFQNVYVQMSITLKHREYRNKWNDIINKKGFLTLLEEMRKPGAHRIFMKDNGDKAFEGNTGAKLYESIVNFLHTIGLKGYRVLLDSVEKIPLTRAEELGLTPAE